MHQLRRRIGWTFTRQSPLDTTDGPTESFSPNAAILLSPAGFVRPATAKGGGRAALFFGLRHDQADVAERKMRSLINDLSGCA